MNLRNRQQLLGLVAIAAVALLAGDRLLLTPLTRYWKQQTTRIADLRQSVTQGALLLDRETAIRERWAAMRTNTLSTELSVAENQMLKAFDRWSQDSGVGISSIKPQWKREGESHTTLECRVDAFGNVATLSRFLHRVEIDPMALRIEALELTARDDEGEQLTLALQVSGLILNRASMP